MTDLPTVEQLSRDDLANMTPEEIAAAHAAGKLNQIVGAPVPLDMERYYADVAEKKQTHRITREELSYMKPEDVVEAYNAGRLAHLVKPGDDA